VRDFGTSKGKEVNMSMKKLIALALCLVIALAFVAGCKKKEEATVTEPAATTTEATPAPQAPMSSAAAPAPEAAPAAK
jgi:hypothetical protein